MKKVLVVLLALSMVFALVACGPKEVTKTYKIGQYIGACHGTSCFSVCTAVIDETDTIVACFIDEFQYMNHTAEGVVAVPNSAEGFGKSYSGDNWLGSKRESNAYYSANMANKGKATQEYVVNMNALQDYCVGKTIADLDKGVDAITGCTFSNDIPNYVKGVVEAAKIAKESKGVEYKYTGDAPTFRLNAITAAAHGTSCFAFVAAFTDDKGTLVLSWVDEYQFMAPGEGVVAVPNSDNLAKNVVEGKVLVSKRQSNVAYSANMANKGNATQEYVVNMNALQDYCNGKAVSELEKGVDAITGCTFSSDIPNYVKAIVQAAK